MFATCSFACPDSRNDLILVMNHVVAARQQFRKMLLTVYGTIRAHNTGIPNLNIHANNLRLVDFGATRTTKRHQLWWERAIANPGNWSSYSASRVQPSIEALKWMNIMSDIFGESRFSLAFFDQWVIFFSTLFMNHQTCQVVEAGERYWCRSTLNNIA